METEVTRVLREKFSFKFVEIEGQKQRMGATGLEAALIGTLVGCPRCVSSSDWLGNFSPKPTGLRERALADSALEIRATE